MFTSFRVGVRPWSDFVCECDPEYRSACVGEEFCGENQGKRYCVLHLPTADKSQSFKNALDRKIQRRDFDFEGVWFPDDVDFTRFGFTDSDFTGATFNGNATFSYANFPESAYFSSSTFNGEADFGAVRFEKGVNFARSVFKHATDFHFAHFMQEVDFTGAHFEGALTFRDAHFGDHARFAGDGHPVFTDDDLSLDLQFARIEKPDRISFHSLLLRPSWFVNVDTRNFRFANVKWNWRTVDDEIGSLKKKTASPHLMLSTAYRNLALNAEENHRYEEGSEFRYRAMDTTRLERAYGWDLFSLSWWYWLASGYGEQVVRAAAMLLSMLVLFAVMYTWVGFARWEPRPSTESEAMAARKDEFGAPLSLRRALTYSGGVMTLQKPDPRPGTTAAQAIVLLETILGPVQAALLALAIRRKFMR
jgi:uncharacterized protein YjbI with pentapeptide repeats